jgi:arginine/ornithine N-succinyltransferase beta subunit
MFASEMKEKSAEKVVLDITGFMEDNQKSPLFQLFLESVYTGILIILKSIHFKSY